MQGNLAAMGCLATYGDCPRTMRRTVRGRASSAAEHPCHRHEHAARTREWQPTMGPEHVVQNYQVIGLPLEGHRMLLVGMMHVLKQGNIDVGAVAKHRVARQVVLSQYLQQLITYFAQGGHMKQVRLVEPDRRASDG